MESNSELATTIVSAESRHVKVPTGMKEAVLPTGQKVNNDLDVLLLRLTDDDGTVAHSMLWLTVADQVPLMEAALRYHAPRVEGHRLDQVPNIPLTLAQSLSFVGHQGVAAFGASAFEMAIEDLICRRRNISLGKALGQVSQKVRAYQTGLMPFTPIDELVAEAQEIYDGGVRAIKMLVGKPRIEQDVERIAAVRAALPDDASLMVDALQKWNYTQARQAVEAFADFDLVWVEDPLDHTDIKGYRDLVRISPVPISTGESLFAVDSFQQLFDARLPYVVGELERVGGIRAWMRLANLAAAHSTTLLPHIFPHLSAHLVSALPQKEVWWEYVPWFDSLLDYTFDINDGFLTVADRPGTGFDLSFDAVENFARSPWQRLTA
jgi:L-alanine-DL-glutamate epimerase-like enolase superfamily enzyme